MHKNPHHTTILPLRRVLREDILTKNTYQIKKKSIYANKYMHLERKKTRIETGIQKNEFNG